jgi:hypothetical protein
MKKILSGMIMMNRSDLFTPLFMFLLCMSLVYPVHIMGQIRDEPYLQGDDVSPNTVVVRWFTYQELDSWVDYGLTEEYEFTTGRSDATMEHRIGLSGLREDTLYHYRVRSGSYESSDGTFHTAFDDPGRGFHFVAYGDNRSNPSIHEFLAECMLNEPAIPSFILNTGDLVAHGEERQ